MNFVKDELNFLKHLEEIKSAIKPNFFSAVNTTLIANPYISDYPRKFIFKEFKDRNLPWLFFKSASKFYIKQFALFFNYTLSHILYNIFFLKRDLRFKNTILIDKFFLVDTIIKEKRFKPRYFIGLYEVLDSLNRDYIFLVRLYGANRNPFKLIEFFKILNSDSRKFLFEFELLKVRDFFKILWLITIYPFKTLKLLTKDRYFNIELILDIEKQQFEAFSRYIIGQKLAKFDIDKIVSWSEFQVVERALNYGLRGQRGRAKIYGSQFYLSYSSYFNTFVSDIDYIHKISPHTVLVNGKYYLLDRERVKYRVGVSFRYRELFTQPIYRGGKDILLLGSYLVKDTKYMLKLLEEFSSVIFKNHPAVDIRALGDIKFNISEESIYNLFKNSKIVVTTASGTAVEAVSCGLSVIIIGNRNNLTSNPLDEYGKGIIWDMAYGKDDILIVYRNLLEKRDSLDLSSYALWYRENFFIEPNRENIIRAFEL